MKIQKFNLQICFVILFVFLLGSAFSQSQVQVKLTQPPPNQLRAADIWKLNIINLTKSAIEITLYGTLEEASAGIIVEGTSKLIKLPPGKKTITYNDVKSGNVNFKSGKWREAFTRTGNAPSGDYKICITVKDKSGEEIGSDCIEQNVEIASPPTLVSPADGETIEDSQPVIFTWMPPKPTPSGQTTYKFKIVEILGNQSPEASIKQSRSFFEKDGIKTTTLQYPENGKKFEAGKKYAWLVNAGGTESYVWSFVMASSNPHLNIDTIIVKCDSLPGVYRYSLKVRNISSSVAMDVKNIYIINAGDIVSIPIPPNPAPVAPSGLTITRNQAYPITNITPNSVVTLTGTINSSTYTGSSFEFYVWAVKSGGITQGDARDISSLPHCSCCEDFIRKVDSLSVTSAGIVNVNLTAGMQPVKKVTAELVYFSVSPGNPDCINCAKESNQFGNFCSASNITGFSSPQLTNLNQSGQCSREVTWSSAQGVLINNVNVSMQLGLPPASTLLACCPDTIRLCIRFSFTDVSCVTCDTMICTKFIRSVGKIKPEKKKLQGQIDNIFIEPSLILTNNLLIPFNKFYYGILGAGMYSLPEEELLNDDIALNPPDDYRKVENGKSGRNIALINEHLEDTYITEQCNTELQLNRPGELSTVDHIVETGVPFVLDMMWTYCHDCGVNSWEIQIPENVTFLNVAENNQLGVNYTNSGNTVTITISNPPAEDGSGNFQINLKLTECVFCDGQVFTFNAKQIFTGLQCEPLNAKITIKAKAELKWKIDNDLTTGNLCAGGIIYNDIRLTSLGTIGAYTLNSPTLTLTTNGAEILGIGVVDIYTNIMTASVPFIDNGDGTVTWSLPNFGCGAGYHRYRVALRYPCNFTGVQQHNVKLKGINPCIPGPQYSEIIFDNPGIINTLVAPACCGGGSGQPHLEKKLLSPTSYFSPDACALSSYLVTFNNVFDSKTYTNVELIDNIPLQVKVTRIFSDINSQYVYGTVDLSYQKNGNNTWYTVQLLNPNVTTDVYSSGPSNLNLAPTEWLSKIKWNYSAINGGKIINNKLEFNLVSPDHGGTVVVQNQEIENKLSASYNYGTVINNEMISLKNTVPNYVTPPHIQKFIYNAASNTSVFETYSSPGGEVIFRLVLRNLSSSTISNIQISDVLGGNFDPSGSPGTVKYCYSSNSFPGVSSMQLESIYNGASPVTGALLSSFTGNTFNLTIPSMPGSCSATNYLVIEFKVKVKPFTLSGTYQNTFKVLWGNSPYISNSVNVIVNDYYSAEALMEVKCPANESWDSTANARQGDLLQYRYKLKNTGNVKIDNIVMVNTKPMPGDLKVVNIVPRNSAFNIDYDCSTSPTSDPTAAMPTLYFAPEAQNNFCRSDMEMPTLPAGCTNPGWVVTCGIAKNEMKIVLPSGFILMPGDEVNIILQAQVSSTATIGQIAYNSFGFMGIRKDLNIPINPGESNDAKVIIDTAGCPPIPDSCSCDSSRWGEIIITNNQLAGESFSAQCGLGYSLSTGQSYTLSTSYHCNPPSCSRAVMYELISPSGNTNGNMPLTFTPAQSGSYTLLLYGWCGDQMICDTCSIWFKVEQGSSENDCCSNFTTNVSTIQSGYLGNNPGIYIINPKLTAGPNKIIKVSATFEYLSVSYDNEECKQCVKNSANFGNFNLAGALGPWNPQMSISPGISSSLQYTREIVWGNINGTTTLDMDPGISTLLWLSVPAQLPGSLSSCCHQVINLCIRYKFTDSTCITCDTLVCYQITDIHLFNWETYYKAQTTTTGDEVFKVNKGRELINGTEIGKLIEKWYSDIETSGGISEMLNKYPNDLKAIMEIVQRLTTKKGVLEKKDIEIIERAIKIADKEIVSAPDGLIENLIKKLRESIGKDWNQLLENIKK